jgi:sulfite exporter TauE/SafE
MPLRLAPLGKRRQKQTRWLRIVVLYTVGGMLSSSSVGSVLGWTGRVISSHASRQGLWGGFALCVLILALRDLRLISFDLPQRRVQAPYEWLHRFEFGSVYFMWGLNIGVGLSTFIEFSGLYAVIAAAIISGSAFFGGSLMLFYWLGRALPVWLAPSIAQRWPIDQMRSAGIESRRLLQAMSSVGLLCCAALGVFLAFHG